MRNLIALLMLAMCLPLPAAMIGQIDTFNTGTEGWITPNPGDPNPPTTAAGGGPGGVADPYLVLTANGGFGPGSRLTVLNETQWTGNFLGAGIGSISMDVRNSGPSDVFLRLLFEHAPTPGPPTDLATSANAIFVAAGTDWTHVVFSIDTGSLLALIGNVSGALSGTTTMRIFSNPDPTFGGPGNGPPAIDVTLGLDNIQALAGSQAIPEPATFGLLAAGLLAACILRRRARA